MKIFKLFLSFIIITIALASILNIDFPYRRIIFVISIFFVIVTDFLYPLVVKIKKDKNTKNV